MLALYLNWFIRNIWFRVSRTERFIQNNCSLRLVVVKSPEKSRISFFPIILILMCILMNGPHPKWMMSSQMAVCPIFWALSRLSQDLFFSLWL